MDESGGDLAFTATADDEGSSLLDALADRLVDVGTTDLRRLIRDRRARVNGRPSSEDHALHAGDQVLVDLPEGNGVERIEPRPIEGFSVLFEDAAAIACQKPAGVTVIPERAERDAPFLGAVLAHLLEGAADGERPARPRVVHRIDKDASGVVLLAKSRDAMRALTAQFEGRTVEKSYLALVRGSPLDDDGEIDLPIGPAAHGTFQMRAGGRDAKPARTTFKVVERFSGVTLLEVSPHTGRQHQIRVHLQAVGYPLAVDPLYGGEEALLLSSVKRGYKGKPGEEERPLLARLALHAFRLRFVSPASGEVRVEAPLPKDLSVTLKQLRRWSAPSRRRPPPGTGNVSSAC